MQQAEIYNFIIKSVCCKTERNSLMTSAICLCSRRPAGTERLRHLLKQPHKHCQQSDIPSACLGCTALHTPRSLLPLSSAALLTRSSCQTSDLVGSSGASPSVYWSRLAPELGSRFAPCTSASFHCHCRHQAVHAAVPAHWSAGIMGSRSIFVLGLA